MANITGAQVARIGQLIKEGKSIPEIAGTVGLDIGDVTSVLSGATRSYVETLELLEGGTPAVTTLTLYTLLATEHDFGSGTGLHVVDLGEFATAPKGALIRAAFVAEASLPGDPRAGGLPINLQAIISMFPVAGTWEREQVDASGGPNNFPADSAIDLVSGNAGTQAMWVQADAGVFTKFGGGLGQQNVYSTYAPQDASIHLRADVLAANDQGAFPAGAKLRNVAVSLEVVAAVAAP